MTAFCVLALTSTAQAEDAMKAMDHSAMVKADAVMPADAFAAARETMHKDMMVRPTGNIDKDFVAGMIPHHEGAVAMAKVVLEKGTDPEIRKLAEGIVAAQEKEIAFMKEWQSKQK